MGHLNGIGVGARWPRFPIRVNGRKKKYTVTTHTVYRVSVHVLGVKYFRDK